ncbi:MAG: hypothetical protein ACRDP7_48460 [Trebonia sp.]
MESWGFLTNHARVLLCVARDPGARLRDIASSLAITERSAYGIVSHLADAGYDVKHKDGRRNRYQVQERLPLRDPAAAETPIGEVPTATVLHATACRASARWRPPGTGGACRSSASPSPRLRGTPLGPAVVTTPASGYRRLRDSTSLALPPRHSARPPGMRRTPAAAPQSTPGRVARAYAPQQPERRPPCWLQSPMAPVATCTPARLHRRHRRRRQEIPLRGREESRGRHRPRPSRPTLPHEIRSRTGFANAGFDHLVAMNVGPDPDGFMDFFARELAAPLRALTPAAA